MTSGAEAKPRCVAKLTRATRAAKAMSCAWLALLCGCGPSVGATTDARVSAVVVPNEVAKDTGQRAKPVVAAPAVAETATPLDSAMVVRDDREGVARRNSGPVDNEITNLERQIDALPSTAAGYPTALVALAEAWTTRRKQTRGTTSTEAGQRAIATYARAVKEYPNMATLDRTLYHLALEQEVAGQLAAARSSYFKLVSEQVSSRFVPHAYLAFGEMFREQAKTEPSQMALARQSYLQVVDMAPTSEGVRTLAALRLREISIFEHKDADADRMLNLAREALDQFPDQHGARELRAMLP